MIAMLMYLASLVDYGHVPGRIGTMRIGRTVYAAGEYTTTPLPMPGVTFPAETRIALFPLYIVGKPNSQLPVRDTYKLPLLPASYRRNRNTVYGINGQVWFIAGWNNSNPILWLAQMPSNSVHFGSRTVMETTVDWWPEDYDAAIQLSTTELLERSE